MYFSSFPTTKVNGVELLDITRKFNLSAISDQDNVLTYMNYSVQEGERPEDIAFYYYDDPALAWLVLLSNNIIDPYTHWPKSTHEFEKYLISEYEKESGKTGQEVINWTQSRTIGTNIVEYRAITDPNISVNRSTWLEKPLTAAENLVEPKASEYGTFDNGRTILDFQNGYSPIRIYDYESELNESRRNIKLVNKSLLPSILAQLETILNDG